MVCLNASRLGFSAWVACSRVMGFAQELSQLQDRVPAFPGAKAEAVVERELGVHPSVAFRTFSRQPFAAASLGQVTQPALPGHLVGATSSQHLSVFRE